MRHRKLKICATEQFKCIFDFLLLAVQIRVYYRKYWYITLQEIQVYYRKQEIQVYHIT